jgi:DNA repair exonuclease SbcCD ATPase subunit
MKIEFLRVVVRDFLAIGAADFPIYSSGMHGVVGEVEGGFSDSNGAGKSSLFEALVWGLYGKTLRGVTGSSVIRNGADSCKVTVFFKKGAVEYCIVRIRTGSSGSVEFSCEETRLSEPHTKDTDKKISDVLGIPFVVFQNSVVHGQGLPYRFIEATDAEKKEVMESLLSLGWLEQARARVSSLKKNYDVLVTNLEVELRVKTAAQCDGWSRLGAIDRKLVDLAEDLKKLQEGFSIQELRKNIEDKRTAEAIIVAEGYEAKRMVSEEDLNIQEAMNKIADMRVSIGKLGSECSSIEEIISRIDSRIGLFQRPKKESSFCPTCGQDINSEQVKIIIGGLVQERENNLKDLDSSRGQIWTIQTLLNQAETEKQDFVTRKKDCLERVQELEVERLGISNYLTNAERFSSDYQNKAGRNSAEKELLESDKAELEARLSIISGELQTIDESRDFCDSIRDVLIFWEHGFSDQGIKSLAIDNIMPFLNEAMEKYLGILADNDIGVSFRSQSETARGGVRDKISASVTMEGATSYVQASGGEKRRVDVAVLLALHDLVAWQNGVDTNIQVFDEVFENLDESGTERLMSLLSERAKDRSIYVISHDSDLLCDISSTLKVRKSPSGVSSVDTSEYHSNM